MFRKALIKLTLLYLLIIMVISFFFSINIYRVSSLEINNNVRKQQMVIERMGPGGIFNNPIIIRERDNILNEAKQRLLINLIYTNLVILVLGGALSYYLAGLTLKPIEESHEVQARFAADASHELRSPLAAMKTEIEVALRDKNLTKEEAIELLESNLEEVDRLKLLAEGLLELTRDNNTISRENFDLKEAVLAASKHLEKKAKEKKIKIHFDLDENVMIYANQDNVKELIDILVDNAIKYSESEKNIYLEVSKKANHGFVSVRDEGIGIEPNDLEKIFERFYRADQSRTKNKVSGYGLGLALAQKIVKANQGTIEVKSNLGEGSTFMVKLPLAIS